MMWMVTDTSGFVVGEAADFISGLVVATPVTFQNNIREFEPTMWNTWEAFVEWADTRGYFYRPVTPTIRENPEAPRQ